VGQVFEQLCVFRLLDTHPKIAEVPTETLSDAVMAYFPRSAMLREIIPNQNKQAVRVVLDPEWDTDGITQGRIRKEEKRLPFNPLIGWAFYSHPRTPRG
jgi:hypothetical protein